MGQPAVSLLYSTTCLVNDLLLYRRFYFQQVRYLYSSRIEVVAMLILTMMLLLVENTSKSSGTSVHVAIHDAFIVKYASPIAMPNHLSEDDPLPAHPTMIRNGNRSSQSFLPLHTDQSSHSFIIPLNSSSEFEGGGTYFPSLDCILRPGAGQALCFPGGILLHGGQPITAGTRYLLAVFAYMADGDALSDDAWQSEFDRECDLSYTDESFATDQPPAVQSDDNEDVNHRIKRPRVDENRSFRASCDITDKSSSSPSIVAVEHHLSQLPCHHQNSWVGEEDGNSRCAFTFGFGVH